MAKEFNTKDERDGCVRCIYNALREYGWPASRTTSFVAKAAQITIPTVYKIIKAENNENTE